jgi:D-beta-D-heptose 7-phosphate kinase/D-beta-D-heptose 1-phosphate adenosyltransferase
MSNPRDLQPLVKRVAERLKEKRLTVAVVGDIILDNAIEGVSGGTHAETNVPVLRQATAQESIGGAANIALALARLGVNVAVYGIVGVDLAGRQLQNLLDRQTLAVYLVTEPGWPTPRKDWIYERQDQRAILRQRIDYDRPPSAHAREELVGEFRARSTEKVDVLILADHGLGSIGIESLPLIALAKERRAQIVAIPRSTMLRGQPVEAVVLNASEMRSMQNAAADADPEPLAAIHARKYDQHVFLSLLDKGIRVCPAGSNGAGTLCSGYKLDSPKWMGARDITTALVAVGLALGLDPIETGLLATVFRHLVAMQRGNGRVLWHDVFQFVGLPDQGA